LYQDIGIDGMPIGFLADLCVLVLTPVGTPDTIAARGMTPLHLRATPVWKRGVVGGMVTFERCLGQDKTLFNIYFQDKFPA
jgi:hypothetical protein